jgi:hypothetical protein
MISPDTILHGELNFVREPPKLTLRPNGLDTVTQLFQNQNPLAFARGGKFPGLANFYITESEPTIEIEGLANEIRLRGEGLADGQTREEENSIEVTDESWDQGPVTFLTLRPDLFERGLVHPHIDTLWCLATQKRRVCGPRNSSEGVWRVSADYKGIIPLSNGLPKGRKRKITVGNRVYNSASKIALGASFVDENGVQTGWGVPQYTALDLSAVQVSDTFLTWDAPPTDGIPGHLTPDNAPPVKDVFASSAWTAGTEFVYNWPWGWTLKSISSEPLIEGLAGTPYLTTLVTEFVQLASPKG